MGFIVGITAVVSVMTGAFNVSSNNPDASNLFAADPQVKEDTYTGALVEQM